MPSTENTTLQRIQREISDVIEREKELRNSYNIPNGNNSEDETNNNIPKEKTYAKPVLMHSKSSGPLTNGTSNNSIRLFTPNPASKGVMHKFIKARGRITVNGFQPSTLPVLQKTLSIPDIIDPPKVTEPGKCIRKGYVPVQERMKKEFEDLHVREMELRLVRRKSQPEFENLDLESPPVEASLKPAKSIAQLYDLDDYHNDFNSPPSSLKPARSLADLCDASEDELDTPGSHSLIMQWEEMIQKNQKDHL